MTLPDKFYRHTHDPLTIEELRIHLSERVPGFMTTLAAAMGWTPRQLCEAINGGRT